MAVTKFSQWLDVHLDQPGVNPTTVAARAGISPSYLSLLRHGDRKVPTNKVLRGLAIAFDASVEEVFDAAEKPLEKVAEYDQSGESAAGGSGSRVQRCSVRTKNTTLVAQITYEETGLAKVAIQFTSTTEQIPKDGHLKWFINNELSHEYSMPFQGVTSRLPAGQHKIVGEWGDEMTALEFSV